VVLFDDVRDGLFPTLFAGLVEAGRVAFAMGVTFAAVLAFASAGRGATKSRGDFSRRSSNVHPRGKVSRAA
jgi:hypothetical protein